MATIVESQAAEETEIVFIGFTGFRIIFHRVDASVLRYVTRQVFPSSDRVVSNFPNKPGNIRDEIHNPFTVRSLLSNPLQVIDLRYLLI